MQFSPKNANFDNFFLKKCNFEKFSTSESEKYGKIFLPAGEIIKFFGRIFTYGNGRNKSKLAWRNKDFFDRPEQKGDFMCSKVFKVYGPNDIDTK